MKSIGIVFQFIKASYYLMIKMILKVLAFMTSSQAEWISEAHRKLALCNKVLDVIGVLTPGKVRMRGMFLSEMYGIVIFLGKHAFNAGEINSDEYLRR